MESLGALKEWLGLAALMISVGSSVGLYIGSGSKKNGAKIEQQERKLIEHDRRLQRVETEITHMPNKETVHKLQVDLTEMKGQMTSMVKSSEATERATRRVEDFLIGRAAN